MLGRLCELKGGEARSKEPTAEQRKEIAELAASVRWRKKGQSDFYTFHLQFY